MTASPSDAAYCGVLLLDKPLGMSSSAATQRVRHLLGKVKAGHIGSLDPLATGMLPICIGEATKIAGVVLEGRKCYRFSVTLGARTATGDAEGEIVERAAVPALTLAAIETAMQAFIGVTRQIPPMYSALKQQGQALYKLARAGITVERAARAIKIDRFDCLAMRADPGVGTQLDCRVICGKGSYVRVLAQDLARSLGSVGHVSALRREWMQPFDPAEMQTLAQVEAKVAAGQAPVLLSPQAALPNAPPLRLSATQAVALAQGQRVGIDPSTAAGLVLALDSHGRMLGLATSDGAGELLAKRLFVAPV